MRGAVVRRSAAGMVAEDEDQHAREEKQNKEADCADDHNILNAEFGLRLGFALRGHGFSFFVAQSMRRKIELHRTLNLLAGKQEALRRGAEGPLARSSLPAQAVIVRLGFEPEKPYQAMNR